MHVADISTSVTDASEGIGTTDGPLLRFEVIEVVVIFYTSSLLARLLIGSSLYCVFGVNGVYILPWIRLRYYSVFDKTLKSSSRRGILVDDVDVCAMMVQSLLCLKTGARNEG